MSKRSRDTSDRPPVGTPGDSPPGKKKRFVLAVRDDLTFKEPEYSPAEAAYRKRCKELLKQYDAEHEWPGGVIGLWDKLNDSYPQMEHLLLRHTHTNMVYQIPEDWSCLVVASYKLFYHERPAPASPVNGVDRICEHAACKHCGICGDLKADPDA